MFTASVIHWAGVNCRCVPNLGNDGTLDILSFHAPRQAWLAVHISAIAPPPQFEEQPLCPACPRFLCSLNTLKERFFAWNSLQTGVHSLCWAMQVRGLGYIWQMDFTLTRQSERIRSSGPCCELAALPYQTSPPKMAALTAHRVCDSSTLKSWLKCSFSRTA